MVNKWNSTALYLSETPFAIAFDILDVNFLYLIIFCYFQEDLQDNFYILNIDLSI